MLTVHLRITDAQTQRPTAARVAVTGPNGQSFAPLGRFAEFPVGINEAVGAGVWMGSEKWFPVDGGCEIKLPAGVPLRVRVTKGPEYVPLDQEVTLGAGQMAVRLSLTRWANPATTGWHSGDGRAHFLSPHAAKLEAAAEGLDLVNLLAAEQLVPGQDGHLYPVATNLDAFSGQSPTLDSVVVNTFNTHPALGKLSLLNSHRPVFPLAFGEDSDDWSLVDWCRQCHRKKGLVVWCDAFRPGVMWGEALVALILAEIDAVEFDPVPRWLAYYKLLDAGFAVPVVGSSGKQTNKVPLGAVRTYARISPLPVGERVAVRPGEGQTEATSDATPGESRLAPHPARKASPPSPQQGEGKECDGRYAAWIEAVRSGRTYATSGPLVEFNVYGSGPGETVDLASPGLIGIRAAAESIVPFDRIEVVRDSEVIASAAATHTDRYAATIDESFSITGSGWLTARCVGPGGSVLSTTPVFAHTSPVVVRVGGDPLPRRAAAFEVLRKEVERVKDWAETAGRYTDAKWKAQLLARCDEALARLESVP
jgi:hypothetical protein